MYIPLPLTETVLSDIALTRTRSVCLAGSCQDMTRRHTGSRRVCWNSVYQVHSWCSSRRIRPRLDMNAFHHHSSLTASQQLHIPLHRSSTDHCRTDHCRACQVSTEFQTKTIKKRTPCPTWIQAYRVSLITLTYLNFSSVFPFTVTCRRLNARVRVTGAGAVKPVSLTWPYRSATDLWGYHHRGTMPELLGAKCEDISCFNVLWPRPTKFCGGRAPAAPHFYSSVTRTYQFIRSCV